MRFSGTMAWVGAIGAAVALGTPAAHGQGLPAGEKPAALVNGEAITFAEVKAVLDQRPSPVPLTEAQKKELRHSALEVLIDDLLMRQFLRKVGGPIAPAAVDKEIEDLKEVLKKQSKTLEHFLHEARQTEAQLRADVAARLHWKSFLVARYPEADIKLYYEANKVAFDKVLVRASHILIKVAPTAPATEKQAARAKLEILRHEILAGKIDFSEAAKKYSDCPSKEKFGDIGQFPYKFVVVEPFARAAFSTKVGEVTDIVTSEFGFHIIKVTDRTAGEVSSFAAVKDAIRDMMAQEQDLYARILAEQRKTAKIEIATP